jgi:hypothetical protein
MASGLPTVCTAAGDTATLLGSVFPEAIVASQSVARYAPILKLLSQDRDLRIKVGEANRNRCLTKYSRDQMIDNYRAAYLSVISGKTTMSLADHHSTRRGQ